MYEKFNLVTDTIIITLRSKVKSSTELNLKLILWLKYWEKKNKKKTHHPKIFCCQCRNIQNISKENLE